MFLHYTIYTLTMRALDLESKTLGCHLGFSLWACCVALDMWSTVSAKVIMKIEWILHNSGAENIPEADGLWKTFMDLNHCAGQGWGRNCWHWGEEYVTLGKLFIINHFLHLIVSNYESNTWLSTRTMMQRYIIQKFLPYPTSSVPQIATVNKPTRILESFSSFFIQT